jgi:ATP-dependent Clp protease protease subunit
MTKKGYIFNQSETNKKKATILIDDDISAWWGVGLRDMANEITNSGASEIMIQICSDGGDVFQGHAIAAFIKGFPANIETCVLGLCASAATFPAMAGKKTYIAKGSRFMIHNASTGLYGEAKDHKQAAELLEDLDGDLVKQYVDTIAKNGKLINDSREETQVQVKEWMVNTTYFSAEDAVKHGFIQEVVDGAKFLNKANSQAIYNSLSRCQNASTEFLNKVKSFTNMAKEEKPMVENNAATGLKDAFLAFLGITPKEETPPVATATEPTAAEKQAAFEAYCKENGLQVQPVAKVEPPKTEDKTAEMEAKIAALEADKQAAKLEAQKLQEQIDGASSAGKPNLRKAETDSPLTPEQKDIENLLAKHDLIEDFNAFASAFNDQ